MTLKTKSNKKHLTDEERAKLLAKVYAVILSPEWKMEESPPKDAHSQNNIAELETTGSIGE